MKDEQTSMEVKKRGTPSHIALYAKIAEKSDKLYDVLFELLYSRNDNIRLGAVKTLLNKILPDLKSVELSGGMNTDGTRRPIELLINAGRGFIPATVQFNAPSTGGHTSKSPEVQSTGVAPQSKEDNDSNTRDSQAGSS